MERTSLKRLGAIIASGAVLLMLVGCRGTTGSAGASGTNGTNGTNGTSGTNGTNGTNGVTVLPTLNAANMTTSDWAGLSIQGAVTGVTMTGANQGIPQVSFTVTDGKGTPIVGLSTFTTKAATDKYASYPNFSFSIAKLVPGAGGTTTWVSYMVSSTPTIASPNATPTKPTTDTVGTMTEDGQGGYTYTFFRDITTMSALIKGYTFTGNNLAADLGDVSYVPTLTHRLSVTIGGTARNTGTNTPTKASGEPSIYPNTYPMNQADLIYDFIPSTGKPIGATDAGRTIAATAACNACHTKLGASFHSGTRNDPNFCVMCHNEQMKYGSADAMTTATVAGTSPALVYTFAQPAVVNGVAPTYNDTLKINGMSLGNMPNFVHKMHMGSELTNQGYGFGGIGINNVNYPQDIRNCTTCHSKSAATPQGDNWKTVPNRIACGSCHDNVNFATGLNHLAAADDSSCASCHTPADIMIEHTPVLTQNGLADGTSTGAYGATNPAHLPTNLATPVHAITAKVKSVGITPITGNAVDLGNPTITFAFFQDGGTTPLVFNAAPATNDASKTSLIPNFVSSPSIFFLLGFPVDGVAPADYNYRTTASIMNVWNKTATTATPTGTFIPTGTLTGPDGSGYYTVTLTSVVIPSGTNIMIGGIGDGGSFIQSNLTKTVGAPPSPDPVFDFTYTAAAVPAPTVPPAAPATPKIGTGGLTVPVPAVWATASFKTTNGGTTSSLARRTIVDTNRCNTCHSNLGAFTSYAFHSGANNDATSCVVCHNTAAGHAANGFGINAKSWVHGIHSAGFRTYPYVLMSNFPGIMYPGVLNDCEACHVPGSYDFSNTANAAQIPNMLWDGNVYGDGVNVTYPSLTVATAQWNAAALPGATKNTNFTAYIPLPAVTGAALPTLPAAQVRGTLATTGTVTLNQSYVAPWVDGTQTYGVGFTATAAASGKGFGGVAQTFVQPAANTLVTSPITASCAGCHDSNIAIAHMTGTGGGVHFGTRTSVAAGATTVNGVANTAITVTETCLICHGPGAVANIHDVHMNF